MKYRSIVRNNEFLRAYQKGKKYYCPYGTLYVFKTRRRVTCLGITCSKKVGNAVARNRARRVVRHGFYSFLPQNIGGYDLVFVANSKTPAAKSDEMGFILQKMLKKAGIFPV